MLSKTRPLWAFLVCCLLLAATTDGARKKTRKRVVCYYTNWSVYRLGLAKYLPSNINPHLCTHLVYAFGGFDDDFQLQPFDKYQDIEKGGYARFNGLKQYNKGLRTLLALGGWSEGSGRFSELVAEPENRQRFIYSVLRYLRQYNFDGLDLDWEYPGSRAGSDFADKENYATLLEELRAAFEDESVKTNRPTLLLTVAVPAGISTIEKGFNVPRLNAAVDFFNILAYDYHASTEALTDHHAPLFALTGASEYDHRTQLNVDYTVRFYLKLGAERRKLVVGIPTYGRSYTLIDENFSGVQAAAESPGLKGKYTKEEGYLSFYEVCENVAVEEWSVYRPYPEEMGPYATKGKQWVGYDDEFIVRKKAEYVRDNRLGGIMFWSIDNDDFRGRCSGKPYPLIEAAKEAYLAPIPGSPPKQAKGPTPAPPATPDPGADFSCKREGFYPHPEECNKYFWCLAGGPLGVVPHSFTCPSGLLFNRRTDACDFPRNVKCKIAVKETVSITFPPTKEPVVGVAPSSGPGEVTEDPLDEYYEDYDPADLPPLDLDFPDTGLSPVRPVPSSGQSSPPEVLGGSRGGATAAKTEAGSAAPEEEESDPSELKQILQLIQKIGGVEGVKKLLEGDSGDPASPQISEKTRKTLNKIVGETPKQDTSSRPRYTSIARGRRPTTTSAETSSAERTSTRTNTRTRLRTSSSSSRRRQQSSSSTTSSRGSTQRRRPPPRSQETEVTPGSRSNARRRRPEPSRSQEETEVVSSGRPNARRRPQYSSIQRNRRPQPTESAVQEQEVQEQEQEPASGPGQRRYVTLNRQRGAQRTSAAAEQEEQQQGEIDPDTGREYVTLRRNRPTTPAPPLEGTSAPTRQSSRRGRPQGSRRGITIRRPGNRATQQFRLTSTLPPRLTTTEEPTTTAAPLPETEETRPEAESQPEEPQQERRRPIAIRPPSNSATRGSARNRFRQRTRGRGPNRLRRPNTTAAPTTTTTTTTTTSPTTTTTTTTTTTQRPVPTTIASVATISDQQVPRPTSQEVRDLDSSVPASPEEDVEYDYYYDYVFEYPDGTVREIPAEELVKLRAEIELAKRLLQAKEGRSLSGGAFDQTLVKDPLVDAEREAAPGAERPNPGGPPRQRLSSNRGAARSSFRSQSRRPPGDTLKASSSRPQQSRRQPTENPFTPTALPQQARRTSSATRGGSLSRSQQSRQSSIGKTDTSNSIGFLDEVPPGYEVAEYEYDIAGDLNEDIVIIEDEQGRRVVSTTYRPVEATENGFRGAEDSTLRPFVIEDSTDPPRSAPGREERPVGRVVPPIRVLNALNQRRQELTTTTELTTEAEPVTTTPRPAPRRTPATIRSFRPRPRQPVEQTTEALLETTTAFPSLKQSAAGRNRERQQQPQEEQPQREEATTWRPLLSPTTIQTLIDRQRQRLGPLRPLSNSRRQSSTISPQPEEPQYVDDAEYDKQFVDDAQYEDYTEYPDDVQFAGVEPTAPPTTATTTTTTTTTTTRATTTTTTTEAVSRETAPAEENEVEPARGGRRFGSQSRFNRLRPGRRRTRPSRREQAATTAEPALSSTTEETVPQTTERTRLAPGRPSRRRRPSSRRQRPSVTTTTPEPSITEAEPEQTQQDQESSTTAPSRRLSAAARRRQSSRLGSSRRRPQFRARPTTTTTTEQPQESEIQAQEEQEQQEQETTTVSPGRRGRRPGLGQSRRRNRVSSLRRRLNRPAAVSTTEQAVETTTEFSPDFTTEAELPTTETAASIRRGTVVPPAVTTAFPPTTSAERTELAFEQFVRDQAQDNMTREQLRELFNRTIQKQAVFVRRKPGSAAPEIIGRGTVISQPGGDRRLIVNNRPGVVETSEITLIESSTLSSLLGTTPVPRTGISPRPEQAPPRPRPLSRPTFRPRLPTLTSQQEETQDQRSAARQVIEDVTARTIASPFDDELRGTSVRSIIQREPGFGRGRDRANEEARFAELGQGLFQLKTQEPFVLPGAEESGQRESFTERSDFGRQGATESSSFDLTGAATGRTDFDAAGFIDRSDQDAKPEASTEHVIHKQVVRLVPPGTRRRPQPPRPTTFSPVQFEEGVEHSRPWREILTSAPRRVQVNRRRLDLSRDGEQTIGEVRIEMPKKEPEEQSDITESPRPQRPQRIRVVSRRRPTSRRSTTERPTTTERPKTAHELALEAHEKAIQEEQKRREEELVRRAEEEKRREEELVRRAEEEKRREEELVRRAEEEKRREEELVRRTEEDERRLGEQGRRDAQKELVSEELDRRTAQENLVAEELARRRAAAREVAALQAQRQAAVQRQRQPADPLESVESVRSSVVSTGADGSQQPLRQEQQLQAVADAAKSDQTAQAAPNANSASSTTDYPPLDGDFWYYDDSDYFYDDDYVRSLPAVDTAALDGSTEATAGDSASASTESPFL